MGLEAGRSQEEVGWHREIPKVRERGALLECRQGTEGPREHSVGQAGSRGSSVLGITDRCKRGDVPKNIASALEAGVLNIRLARTPTSTLFGKANWPRASRPLDVSTPFQLGMSSSRLSLGNDPKCRPSCVR